MRSKVLVIGTLPPPITGQSLAVSVFLDKLKIQNKNLLVETINLSKSNIQNGISFGRFFNLIKIFGKIIVLSRNSNIIYITISESLFGNFKDIIIYLLLYNKLNKVVIHLHGGAGMKNIMNSYILASINNHFNKKFKKIIVLGQSLKEIYRNIDQNKIEIVANFAQDNYFIDSDEIERKYNNLEPLRLLFLSNLIPGKGYKELLEAYCRLLPIIKNQIEINFAGAFESNNNKKEFLSTISKIEGVNYHGIVYGNQKKDLLFNSHVFCLPTYYPYEGQPISILEAYASGCNVLTTYHSGIVDIFTNNINGKVVKKESIESIMDSILYFLENKNTLKTIGVHNWHYAQSKFKEIHYYDNLYNSIFK